MLKKATVAGCILWITGLAATIVGLNLNGPARTWVSLAGNIVFLIGLGITGAVWFSRKKEKEKAADE